MALGMRRVGLSGMAARERIRRIIPFALIGGMTLLVGVITALDAFPIVGLIATLLLGLCLVYLIFAPDMMGVAHAPAAPPLALPAPEQPRIHRGGAPVGQPQGAISLEIIGNGTPISLRRIAALLAALRDDVAAVAAIEMAEALALTRSDAAGGWSCAVSGGGEAAAPLLGRMNAYLRTPLEARSQVVDICIDIVLEKEAERCRILLAGRAISIDRSIAVRHTLDHADGRATDSIAPISGEGQVTSLMPLSIRLTDEREEIMLADRRASRIQLVKGARYRLAGVVMRSGAGTAIGARADRMERIR